MSFNKQKDKIVIAIPRFKLLKKHAEPFEGSYNEPYIVSLSIDARNNQKPKIEFNYNVYPKVAAGDTVEMLGEGHVVYGPDNPGEYVATSILVMDSDRDIRTLGEEILKILQSKIVDLGIGAILVSNPGAAGIVAALKIIIQEIAVGLSNNKDDELFRVEGVFLRDSETPYKINSEEIVRNSYIEMTVKVVPMVSTIDIIKHPKEVDLGSVVILSNKI